MDYTLHIANILYLFSFMMRDILWLRVLVAVAALFLVSYFYFQPQPLLAPIYWNLAFTALNLFWIGRLLYERRPMRMSERELWLYRNVFDCLSPREMVTLLRLGRWEEAAPGMRFCETEDVLDRLMVIAAGSADVWMNDTRVGTLGRGQFIGGMSFVTGKPVGATVIACAPTSYVVWGKQKLHGAFKDNPELHATVQMIIGRELSRDLRATWEQVSGVHAATPAPQPISD